jgi:hypothetical protein
MNQRDFFRVSNLKTVFKNRSLRSKYVFTYEPTGERYYTVDGKKVTIEKFNEMFPIEFKKISSKGDNPDIRKNWVNGGKSY